MESIMATVKAKASKGYLNNPNLKQIGEVINFTQEMVIEYAKCVEDPIYFLETYGKIISLDHGVVPFKLHGYQKELIESFHLNKKTLGKLFRQSGKCHDSTTKYTVRNRTTNEILHLTAEEFHLLTKQSKDDQTL